MLKFIGAVLLLCGASALGFLAAARLRARVDCLCAFGGALARMEQEIAFSLMPLPRVFALLETCAEPPVNLVFARLSLAAERLGETPLHLAWERALAGTALPLEEEELAILKGLGGMLGRYDGPEQCRALARARVQLERCTEQARQERDRLGQVYRTMGMTAGAFLVLMLL